MCFLMMFSTIFILPIIVLAEVVSIRSSEALSSSESPWDQMTFSSNLALFPLDQTESLSEPAQSDGELDSFFVELSGSLFENTDNSTSADDVPISDGFLDLADCLNLMLLPALDKSRLDEQTIAENAKTQAAVQQFPHSMAKICRPVPPDGTNSSACGPSKPNKC